MAFPHHPPFVKALSLGFLPRAKVDRRGVTIVILLVFVVLLWVAVLAPSAWRRFGERQGVGSIDHFHHQLQLLEHAGPKTVAPAYRLHTALPGGRSRKQSPTRPLTRHDRSWCCCDRRTTPRRPTSTAARARTTSVSACWTVPSRSASPRPTCRIAGLPPRAGAPALHHVAALPGRRGHLDRTDRPVSRPAPGLGVHRPLGPGGTGAGRSDGLCQGARGRAGPAAASRHGVRCGPASGPDGDAPGYPGAWDDDDFEVPQAAAR